MKLIHIILKNTIENSIHEHIIIRNCGTATNDDMYLRIYSDEKLPTANPPMGKFALSDIVGYWIEEKENANDKR